MATLSVFGTMGGTSSTENVTFIGTGTTWTSTAPTFAMTGTGNSIGSIVVVDDTHATAVVTCGAVNSPWIVTDSTTGATTTFTIAAATTYDITDASIYGHSVQIEGLPTLGTSWGGIYDGCIRFRGTIGQVDVLSANMEFCRIAIDGVMQNVPTPTYYALPAGYTWQCFAIGLDATTEHEYKLYFGSISGTKSFYVEKVRTYGGSGLNAASIPARPIVAIQGDSVTTGSGIPGFDSTLCWPSRLGAASSLQIANRSYASGSISQGNPTNPSYAPNSVAQNTDRITGLAVAPTVIYFLDGVVDVLDLNTGPDLTQFGTDYAAILAAWRGAWPNAWIICPKIQPNGPDGTSLSAVAPYNTMIAAAVTAAADPRITLSTAIYDIVVSTGLTGYHPHVAESVQWAAIIAGEIYGAFNRKPASGGGQLGAFKGGLMTSGRM